MTNLDRQKKHYFKNLFLLLLFLLIHDGSGFRRSATTRIRSRLKMAPAKQAAGAASRSRLKWLRHWGTGTRPLVPLRLTRRVISLMRTGARRLDRSF